MIGLDTNVLVRFLVQDDQAQAARAQEVIAAAVEAGERLYLNRIVLCELVWVLAGAYEEPKVEIAGTLERLLRAEQIEVERRDEVRRALDRYRSGRGDYADYLIGEGNQRDGCLHTVTFDRDLSKEAGFELL